MARQGTSSFVTELPLRVSSAQERQLLVRLDAARQIYNACLGECLQRLDRLRQSKAYQAARKTSKGKARTKAFREANMAVGFREYDIHAYAAQFNHCWLGEHLDINTIQTLATRAFRATQQYAFGKRGRPHFKRKGQLHSVEGKDNKCGIRWREHRVEWLDLSLEAVIDWDDPVVAHGLRSRVKYARLLRRQFNGRNRFYVQLVCKGRPYQKPQNQIGSGTVGLDIGPSTIAVVSETEALLLQFCDELQSRQKEIRRLQRKIDRQRRANNPANYHPDGTVKKGTRAWRKSNRQRRTEAQLAELQRKQAAHRKSLHGQLANHILKLGDVVKAEKLSYQAFQRRFGKSVQFRAPGTFMALLRRKVEDAGLELDEFPTRTTRLSQVCHNCGQVVQKPLSQRWHACDCGVVAQRDLYSAFLARYVEDGRLNADRARAAWSSADLLLRAALSQIEQPASGERLPSSFGLTGQRQSRSPAN